MELNQLGKGIKQKEISLKKKGILIEDISKEIDQLKKRMITPINLSIQSLNLQWNIQFKDLALEDRNNFEEAIRICDQILQSDQLNIQALYKKSSFNIKYQQRLDKRSNTVNRSSFTNQCQLCACSQFKKAFECLQIMRGDSKEKQRYFEESIEFFDNAFNIDNSFVDAYKICKIIKKLLNVMICRQRLFQRIIQQIIIEAHKQLQYIGITLVDLYRYEEALTSNDQKSFQIQLFIYILQSGYILVIIRNFFRIYQDNLRINSLKRNNQAILCFDKVISVEPNHAKSYLNNNYFYITLF
ncbi:unnamed protein product [Paramecium pentaurelia]|uniref:Tetratricopeptide repeat protein n=1 Tax=Paramecium pentaurelia TaxID=43138 RepID=A0A8S1Y0D4_9CILI|nr:unnamed protein product [Paramecium pentaurelia]